MPRASVQADNPDYTPLHRIAERMGIPYAAAYARAKARGVRLYPNTDGEWTVRSGDEHLLEARKV